MALVAFIFLFPWLGAALLPCLRPLLGRQIGRWALIPPATSFLITLTFVTSTSHDQGMRYALPWFPTLGVNFALWIDGLSLFFALLIAGMGLLITWYSHYYLDPRERQVRFYAYLLCFMGAMLGLVLSANLLTLFVFWELTSISSFLLIGFWQTRPESLYGARQALLVTVLGGLALLGGLLMLYQVTGTLELPELAKSSEVIRDSPLYPAILGLVLVGAGAKSAQFPLHFWLPNAMAAPTPVSAYLHSATMVKAGLFLVCRMLPVLGGTETWMYAVMTIGLVTFFVGGILALWQHDLKALLAYSTISQLGAIMLLFGPGTAESVRAAIFHLFNHATFKGALFLLVGIIEHQAGTRDRRELTGLLSRLPVTGTLAAIAALSMAGVPPFNGFLSKELAYDALLTSPSPTGLGLAPPRPFRGWESSDGDLFSGDRAWHLLRENTQDPDGSSPRPLHRHAPGPSAVGRSVRPTWCNPALARRRAPDASRVQCHWTAALSPSRLVAWPEPPRLDEPGDARGGRHALCCRGLSPRLEVILAATRELQCAL